MKNKIIDSILRVIKRKLFV